VQRLSDVHDPGVGQLVQRISFHTHIELETVEVDHAAASPLDQALPKLGAGFVVVLHLGHLAVGARVIHCWSSISHGS